LTSVVAALADTLGLGGAIMWQSEQFNFALGTRWLSCLKLEELGLVIAGARVLLLRLGWIVLCWPAWALTAPVEEISW